MIFYRSVDAVLMDKDYWLIKITKKVLFMRSITKLDLQYAHRFYGFKGEAQYLHGHTGVLTIEVEGSIDRKSVV